MTNPLDEQRAAHVRCLQDFAAAYDAESENGRALRAAIAALTAPPLCAKPVAWMDRDKYVWTDLAHRAKYYKNQAPQDDHDPEPLYTTPAQPRREVTGAEVDVAYGVWSASFYNADQSARDAMRAALESFANGGDGKANPCKCVDCGGIEPAHSNDCTYMAETFGEKPQRDPDLCDHGNHPADGCAYCMVASKADSAQGDWVLVPRHYAENAGYAAAMLEASESKIDQINAPPLRALCKLLASAPTPQPEGGRGEAVGWADLPWRAATGWLRSASGSKIAEVGQGAHCISQRESELIAAAVNAYATPTDAARVRDAAVAELIEADKEYDAANRDWEHVTGHEPEDTSEAEWRRIADRFEAAVMRRIAALAAVEGEGHVD